MQQRLGSTIYPWHVACTVLFLLACCCSTPLHLDEVNTGAHILRFQICAKPLPTTACICCSLMPKYCMLLKNGMHTSRITMGCSFTAVSLKLSHFVTAQVSVEVRYTSTHTMVTGEEQVCCWSRLRPLGRRAQCCCGGWKGGQLSESRALCSLLWTPCFSKCPQFHGQRYKPTHRLRPLKPGWLSSRGTWSRPNGLCCCSLTGTARQPSLAYQHAPATF